MHKMSKHIFWGKIRKKWTDVLSAEFAVLVIKINLFHKNGLGLQFSFSEWNLPYLSLVFRETGLSKQCRPKSDTPESIPLATHPAVFRHR